MSTRTVCAAAAVATTSSAVKKIKQRTSSDRIHTSPKVFTITVRPAQIDSAELRYVRFGRLPSKNNENRKES
jgi:hypothetical protein